MINQSLTPEAIEQRVMKGIAYIRQGMTLKQSAKRAHCCNGTLAKRMKELGLETKRQKAMKQIEL